jgi:hypothetical protein
MTRASGVSRQLHPQPRSNSRTKFGARRRAGLPTPRSRPADPILRAVPQVEAAGAEAASVEPPSDEETSPRRALVHESTSPGVLSRRTEWQPCHRRSAAASKCAGRCVTSVIRSECGTTASRLVGDPRALFGEPGATLRRRPVVRESKSSFESTRFPSVSESAVLTHGEAFRSAFARARSRHRPSPRTSTLVRKCTSVPMCTSHVCNCVEEVPAGRHIGVIEIG